MYQSIALVLLALSICVFGFMVFIISTKAMVLWKQRLSLDEYAIRLDQDVQKSRDLLNNMVAGALVEWSLYHIRTEKESYMTDEKQYECLSWVIERVIETSSPAIIEQIAIGYPAENREQYIESIKNIAMIHVMEFCIKQNQKDMEDGIPNVFINPDSL